ncbi:hypothetical protein MKEN_01061400 [Mycena kentingensis (nom. inval.)]|nr:hypothetical protein MKEN_01061400 [Mycena kentingensis (nom. inval.)]
MQRSLRRCVATNGHPAAPITDRILLLSLDPTSSPPRAPLLGRPIQVSRYTVAETRTSTRILPSTRVPIPQFVPPAIGTNIASATRVLPHALRRSYLPMLLQAASLDRRISQALPRNDVVSEQSALCKLMLRRSASFTASIHNGVLFFANHVPERKRYPVPARTIHFRNACRQRSASKSNTHLTATTVLSRALGGLNLLIASPVECVSPAHAQAVKHVVERAPPTSVQLLAATAPALSAISPMRLKEAFFSALLSDTRTTFVGLLDDNLVLRETHTLSRDALLAALPNPQWSPLPGIGRAYRTLSALRDHLQEQEDADGVAARQTGTQPAKARWRVELVATAVEREEDGAVEVYVQRLDEPAEDDLTNALPDFSQY